MCGIVGFFRKGPGEVPLGEVLLRMLTALGCRGPDSVGVALYGARRATGTVARVKLAESEAVEPQVDAIVRALGRLTAVEKSTVTDSVVRLELANGAPTRDVEQAIERAVVGTEVLSLGHRLEIVKRLGGAADLDASYHVRGFQGTHAIGHTRLATESRVDLSHSQPFWAHGRPDLAAVHNGHITNYHRLRTIYEMKGRRFYTENDSEIIPAYLDLQLQRGASFEQALRQSVRDLDGAFSYLAATADQLGFAKDFFSSKPLLMAETEDAVVLANEEVAIHAAFGRDLHAVELPAGEVRTWSR